MPPISLRLERITFCGVKGNQGDLHKELIDQFEFAARQLGTGGLSKTNWSEHHEEEKNRGRLERRRTIVCHNLDWMDAKIRSAWQALACIVLVQRQVLLKSGKWRHRSALLHQQPGGSEGQENAKIYP